MKIGKDQVIVKVMSKVLGAETKRRKSDNSEYNVVTYMWAGKPVTDMTTLTVNELEELDETLNMEITVKIERGKYDKYIVEDIKPVE